MLDLKHSRPLVMLTRKNVPEIVLHGFAVAKFEGVSLPHPLSDLPIVMRSLLKPWQAFVCSQVLGETCSSMGWSSHSGEDQHIKQLETFSKKHDLDPNALICPRNFSAAEKKAERIFHPCSGKHLMFLAAAHLEENFDGEYWKEDHPIQKRLFNLIGKESGSKVQWTTDSCGVPTAILSLQALLNLWEKMVHSKLAEWEKIRKLWIENPQLIGGSKRLDTAIVEVSKGQLLAKEAADGMLVVQMLPQGDAKKTAACFVKIASGYQTAHLALGLLSAIHNHPDLPKPFQDLAEYLRARQEEWVPKDQKLVIL